MPRDRTFGAASARVPQRDVQLAGSYFADVNGHYIAEGFAAVTLTPDVAAPRFVIGAAEALADPWVLVGAQYRRSPYGLLSRASAPITRPAQLAGKRIGISPADLPVWTAFARVTRVSAAVIVSSTDPQDVTRGVVDARLAFLPREENVLVSQNIRFATMPLAEHGYAVPGGVYAVRREFLRTDRDIVKAFLRAEIDGWKDALADPRGAADLAMRYGAGLGLSLDVERRQSIAQNALVGASRPLFLLTSTDVSAATEALGAGRFDLGPLREIYAEDPSMVIR